MSTLAALSWVALTTAINQVQSPNTFLGRLLFPENTRVEYPTEEVELSCVTGVRKIAPFVRKGAEAVLVSGTGNKFLSVSGPNIRIKQPFNPSRFFQRQPGTAIHLTTSQDPTTEIERGITRDLQYMGDQITNAEEYLIAMMLQGKIEYVQTDGEVITITIPRSGDNNITPSEFWDDGSGGPNADATPLLNVHVVKEVIAAASCPAPTDAICGQEAAHALLTLVEAGSIKLLGTSANSGAVSVGTMTFVEQFRDDGAMFLGELGGVRFWQYDRTADLNGTPVSMIRSKYIEFVSVSPAARRQMMYAAIPDFKALQQRLLMSRRFSKSWEQEDPSVRMVLAHSRPLPWPFLPDASVSFKAVSG